MAVNGSTVAKLFQDAVMTKLLQLVVCELYSIIGCYLSVLSMYFAPVIRTPFQYKLAGYRIYGMYHSFEAIAKDELLIAVITGGERL